MILKQTNEHDIAIEMGPRAIRGGLMIKIRAPHFLEKHPNPNPSSNSTFHFLKINELCFK